MRIWARYFVAFGMFGLVLGTAYWFRTHEWAGSVLLWTMALMPAIVLAFAARRGAFGAPLPEDERDADPSTGAGEEVGTFPTASAWPLIAVLAAVVLGAAVVYGWILAPVGVGLLGWAVVGLMRESRD